MKLVVVDDYDALSRAGADAIAEVVARKPDAAIVVATGDTPMGAYEELAARHSRGEVAASRVRAFQLDEYLGVPPGDRRSLYGWMERSFVRPLGLPEAHVVRLPWEEATAGEGIEAYVRAVAAAGGFDLAVLGLGPNGHLGFNEPPSHADSPTRMVSLTDASIESNAGYWGGAGVVPAALPRRRDPRGARGLAHGRGASHLEAVAGRAVLRGLIRWCLLITA